MESVVDGFVGMGRERTGWLPIGAVCCSDSDIEEGESDDLERFTWLALCTV